MVKKTIKKKPNRVSLTKTVRAKPKPRTRGVKKPKVNPMGLIWDEPMARWIDTLDLENQFRPYRDDEVNPMDVLMLTKAMLVEEELCSTVRNRLLEIPPTDFARAVGFVIPTPWQQWKKDLKAFWWTPSYEELLQDMGMPKRSPWPKLKESTRLLWRSWTKSFKNLFGR